MFWTFVIFVVIQFLFFFYLMQVTSHIFTVQFLCPHTSGTPLLCGVVYLPRDCMICMLLQSNASLPGSFLLCFTFQTIQTITFNSSRRLFVLLRVATKNMIEFFTLQFVLFCPKSLSSLIFVQGWGSIPLQSLSWGCLE